MLHDLKSSNISMMINSRKEREARPVAHTGGGNIQCSGREGRNVVRRPFVELNIKGIIILKWLLKKQDEMAWAKSS